MNKGPVVHFVGIGGIGMSALARWFLAKKWAISGSDAAGSATTRELEKEGVKVKIGHKKANIGGNVALIIRSQAVRPENPELREGRRRGIPVLSYPEAVGQVIADSPLVAIAGTHGKSTTTAMIALMLIKAGFDPTVFIGTKLKEFGNKNFRAGRDPLVVLEADEYGKAFLNYSPLLTVVTNVDREHVDTYPTIADTKRAFLSFLSRTRENGAIVLNREDPALASLKSKIEAIAKKRKLKIVWYAKDRKIRLSVPGAHNLSNASGALKTVELLGVSLALAKKVLLTYQGSWRRMEHRGTIRIKDSKLKILVYDDYAHHPTEIRATIQAFREKYPNHPLLCAFQPHQSKRLEALFKEFTGSFDQADGVFFLPSYKVAGRDKREGRKDSRALAEAVARRLSDRPVEYIKDPKKLSKSYLGQYFHFLPPPLPHASHSREAILVMMGAGDITDYTDKLLR